MYKYFAEQTDTNPKNGEFDGENLQEGLARRDGEDELEIGKEK